MKKWFAVPVILLVLGLAFKVFDLPFNNLLMAIGFVWLEVLFIIYFIKTFKEISQLTKMLGIALILSSFALYTRYMYFLIGDYPSLIIIPCFLLIATAYLITEKNKPQFLTVTTIVYMVLSVFIFLPNTSHIALGIMPNKVKSKYGIVHGIKLEYQIEIDNVEAEKLYIKGIDYGKENQFSKALIELNRANGIEPNNLNILMELSTNYAKLGNFEKAFEFINRAVELYPNDERPFNNRGLLYYKNSQDKKAIEDFNRVIEINPTRGYPYANLAFCYYYLEKKEQACDAVTKAKELGFDISHSKILVEIDEEFCD